MLGSVIAPYSKPAYERLVLGIHAAKIRDREGVATLLNNESDTPFESIEGAQEYLRLLCAAVLETRQDVEADASAQAVSEPQRRVEALRLVLYKLEQLEKHVKTSHRILNDLRTLRRLLLEERTGIAEVPAADVSVAKVDELDGSCEMAQSDSATA